MKTFATKEKQSAPAVRKVRPYVHHPMGPVQLAQQAEVRGILRSTDVQAKLTIGQPNDKYEQEADRVADQVMRMKDADVAQHQPENEEEEEGLIQPKSIADQITPLVQRQVDVDEEEEEEIQGKIENGSNLQRQEDIPEEEEDNEPVQTKVKDGKIQTVKPGLQGRINSLKGGGQPLSKSVRVYFETRFGTDFSKVRVYTGFNAATTAKSINARAFTTGKDVVFGAGQYSPETSSGKQLLAHELVHVVQQTQRIAAGRIQRQVPAAPARLNWNNTRALAARLVRSGGASRRRGVVLLRQLLIRAAAAVRTPAPLVRRVPTARDISIVIKKKRWGRFDAFVNPALVPRTPCNYWRWIRFFPSSVQDEAYTRSMIAHELDHAAHVKALHDRWRVVPRRRDQTWGKFMLRYQRAHLGRAFGLGGVVTLLAGLPRRIRPTLVEFRAYATQLVRHFHRVTIPKQDHIVAGLVLHYPVVPRIRTILSRIIDPSMNLVTVRNRVLGYFRNPPVRGATPKQTRRHRETIRYLLCNAFRGALVHRPADSVTIRSDYAPLFKSPEMRRINLIRRIPHRGFRQRLWRVIQLIMNRYRPFP